MFALVLFVSAGFYFCIDPIAVFLYAVALTLFAYELLSPGKKAASLALMLTSAAIPVAILVDLLVPIELVATQYAAFDAYVVEHFHTALVGMAASGPIAALVGIALGLATAPRFPAAARAPLALGLVLLGFTYGVLTFDREVFTLYGRMPERQHSHDAFQFIRTFYLMKQGHGFYDAAGESFRNLYTAFYGWRFPTLFYIWSTLLPEDGRALIYLYAVVAVIGAVAAYFLCVRLATPMLGVLGALLFLNLYYKCLFSLWSNEFELWASVLVVAGLALAAYQRLWAALGCFALALFVRELFALHFLLFSAWLLACGRRRHFAAAVGILVLYAGAFALHLHAVRTYLESRGTALEMTTGQRMSGGPVFVARTMQLGSAMLCGKLFTMAMETVLAVYGSARAALPTPGRVFLISLVVAPIAAFMVIGGPGNDYWGGIYLPVVTALCPLGIAPFVRKDR